MRLNSVSQERMQELKTRSKRCVCKYCGGKLSVKLLDFGQAETANMEIFCDNCDRIEYGTEPEIYNNAVFLVDHMGFHAYPDREQDSTTRKLNINKVCEIIGWHERQIGILDENGYHVTITNNQDLLDCSDGSIIVIGDDLAEEVDDQW